MAHRRSDTAPGGGPVTADERARAAGTADPGVAGDTHVAGPGSTAARPPSETEPPGSAASGTAPPRRPGTSPGTAEAGTKAGVGPDTRPDFRPDLGPDARTGTAPGTARGTTPAPGAPAGRAAGGAVSPERATGPRTLPERLLDPAEADRLRARFRELQSSFVDDPRATVRDADGLVTEAAESLARALAGHREALADGLGTGADASAGAPDTERLRLALRAYRDLLDRVAGL
ncbi:hypothetical protein ACFHW2_27875 [Actinomadura sp. LOL_016]|uniref:hypothetical protein n=1 Tax=unclassified Actinomadura TaxID=2626254 RepID=UPI003A80F228